MLSAIAVLDGLAALTLHLLLPRGIRTVARVLGIIGFVWLIGFLVSLICYPVRSERIGFGSVSSMTSAARRPRSSQPLYSIGKPTIAGFPIEQLRRPAAAQPRVTGLGNPRPRTNGGIRP